MASINQAGLNPLKGGILGPTGAATGPWYDPVSLFTKHSTQAPAPDPTSNDYTSDAGISSIGDRVKNGTYQFGSNDGAAIAIKQYQALFGRNPTVPELNSAISLSNGNVNGYIAGLYQQSQQKTPLQLQQQQQQDALNAYNGNKQTYDATTNTVFQQATGRQATPDELAHFGSLLATGATDSYGLSQLIGQTQEAQQAQTQKYQDTLSGNLQKTQGDYFQNYINPSILSQTAAAGRDPNSSGVQTAEVQAGKQQNYDLQNYLANFGASQYSQSAQNQQGVYNQYLQNQYQLQNGGINQKLGTQAFNQSQNASSLNYGIQQNAYQNYLNNYGKSGVSAAQGALSGGASGASAGASFGPWGALIGGVGGAALGAYGSGKL